MMMFEGSIRQGEIWLVNFEPQVGSEITKTRPAVVIGGDEIANLQTRIVVPLTSWQDKFDNKIWLVKIEPSLDNRICKDSAANCSQIKSFDTSRFTRRLGYLEQEPLYKIHRAIIKITNIKPPLPSLQFS